MLKRSAPILLMLSMTTSTLAATGESVKRVVPRTENKFNQYLARGLNVGLEYSAMSLNIELANGSPIYTKDKTFNFGFC